MTRERIDTPVIPQEHLDIIMDVNHVKLNAAVLENRVSTIEATIKKGFDENRKQMEGFNEKLSSFKEVLTKNSVRIGVLWASLATAATTLIHQLKGF